MSHVKKINLSLEGNGEQHMVIYIMKGMGHMTD